MNHTRQIMYRSNLWNYADFISVEIYLLFTERNQFLEEKKRVLEHQLVAVSAVTVSG